MVVCNCIEVRGNTSPHFAAQARRRLGAPLLPLRSARRTRRVVLLRLDGMCIGCMTSLFKMSCCFIRMQEVYKNITHNCSFHQEHIRFFWLIFSMKTLFTKISFYVPMQTLKTPALLSVEQKNIFLLHIDGNSHTQLGKLAK